MNSDNLALLDWDYTLHEGFTLFEWCSFLDSHGAIDPTVARTLVDLLSTYTAGELTYRELFELSPALYAQGLRGQSVETISHLAESFVKQDRSFVFDFTKPLIGLLLHLDIHPIVVSGSPVEILRAYVGDFAWAEVFGIDVAQKDGRYLPILTCNPATGETKGEITSALSAEYHIAAAFGDSEADVPMLIAAKAKIVVSNPGLITPAADVLHISPDLPTVEVMRKVRELLDHQAPV